jgi:hypothetical protein
VKKPEVERSTRVLKKQEVLHLKLMAPEQDGSGRDPL